MTARTKSLHQNTGAWLYTNGHFTSAYPTVTQGEAFATLDEFCNDVSTTAQLKSDCTPKLVGQNTPFLKLAWKCHIDLTYAKPEHVNQIHPVDLKMHELKRQTWTKMIQK